jgi:hypothetical protein
VVEHLTARLLASTGRGPSSGEVRSWNASLPILATDLAAAGLSNIEVLVEHQLPLTSQRIDVVLAGVHPKTGRDSFVVLELKQWHEAELFEGNDALVQIDAYGKRPIAHPVRQLAGYVNYLQDYLPGLANDESTIAACAYLHNATHQSVIDLFDLAEVRDYPVFTGDAKAAFHEFLLDKLDPDTPGIEAADRLIAMRSAPTTQLLAVAAEEIQSREQFVLLADQRLAYDVVMHEVSKAQQADHKSVVVISGGPGSGKSVIALSLMGELARQGSKVLHATGSRSFTQTLRKVAAKGSPRVRTMFKYFNQFMDAEPNSLDVLILDEAHRIRETSVSRFTKKALRSDRPQIDELISVARVPVFLLDQHQVVKPDELGTVEEITAFAEGRGLTVRTVSLDEQFRCGGSDAYIHWVERLLGLAPGGPIPWPQDETFQVLFANGPEAMQGFLKARIDDGFGARMTAGYCWPWSNPDEQGNLVPDVTIGEWSRPWNLKSDRAIGGAPPAPLWATDPTGFGQVGCIYTAQGFEYDWNGVIFGPDFVWRTDRWVSVREANKDPSLRSRKSISDAEFHRLVRNVYKVLLTRGMIGTVTYSCDAETQALFMSLSGAISKWGAAIWCE